MLIPDDNNKSQKISFMHANQMLLEGLAAWGRYCEKLDGLFNNKNNNNMETKELKIQVPEGYEIDKENSTFECIKFKPIKKAVSYEDIEKLLFNGENIDYCINAQSRTKGSIFNTTDMEFIQCVSEKQLAKVIAIAKLMNVAKYLNGKDWQPDWDNGEKGKYYIYHQNGKFNIDYVYSYTTMNIYFKSEEAAQQAIDILGEDTIRLALSTDY